MSKITLNIGLNVGATEPQNQLSATLAALVAAGFVVTDTRIASGEWQGVTERTLVAVVLPLVHIDAKLAGLCVMLNQDAVAYYVEEFGAFRLVFPDGAVNAGDRDLFQHIGTIKRDTENARAPAPSPVEHRANLTIIWNRADVRSQWPDATDAQCAAVFDYLERTFDANIGVTWDVIDDACIEVKKA